MAKVKTSISIDADLYKKLMDKAKEQKRSFSQHISYIAETSKEAAFKTDLKKIRDELKGVGSNANKEGKNRTI